MNRNILYIGLFLIIGNILAQNAITEQQIEKSTNEYKVKIIKMPITPIKYIITDDFYNRSGLTLDKVTLTPIYSEKRGIPLNLDKIRLIKPGQYELTLIKEGYHPICTKVTIEKNERICQIKAKLLCKHRKIHWQIKSRFEENHIPDEIALNGKPIKENENIKPGEYLLTIKKQGYMSIYKRIVILPSEHKYNIYEYLVALDREKK